MRFLRVITARLNGEIRKFKSFILFLMLASAQGYHVDATERRMMSAEVWFMVRFK